MEVVKLRCINNCEFQKFENSNFRCEFYGNVTLDIQTDSGNIEIFRCKDCIEDKTIGTNSLDEKVRKIKKYIGEFADNFYTFKDDFENTFNDVYRIIKELEDLSEEIKLDKNKEN